MEFFRIEPSIESYPVGVRREDVLAVCDILGFGNYVMSTDFEEHSSFVATVLGFLKSCEKTAFDRILRGKSSLKEALGDEWIEKFGFTTLLVSDTIVLYPKVRYVTLKQLEITLQVLSIMLSMLYVYLLKDWAMLLRGVITYGEYGVIPEYPLIWGKGVIEAYRYEKMQNWSGVLLDPGICKVVERSLILNHDYIPYQDIPLKKNRDAERFWSECEEASMGPHALDWVKRTDADEQEIDEAFWGIIKFIDDTLDGSEKLAAIEKVLNTRKFYYYVLNLKKQ